MNSNENSINNESAKDIIESVREPFEDLTGRNKAQDYLKSFEFSNSIVNTIRSPIIILDTELVVVSANEFFYKTFKVTSKDTLEKHLDEIGNGQWNIPKLRKLLNKILTKDKDVNNFEVEHDFLDIGKKIMLLNATRLISPKIKKKFILLSIEDITLRKQAEDEIERIYQAKLAFTSMVSHELRTPLTSLKESLSIVSSGKIGPINQEQASFLDIAKRNLDRLISLINDVLTFQKLEAKKMVFNLQENDIDTAFKEVKDIMTPLAQKKGLDFIVNNTIKQKAVFDMNTIIAVLINLVGNAIKLTDKGWVKLSANYNPRDSFIEISVEDTGCGIKKDDLPKLFHAFEQIKRKSGGTGLGLIISKQIVEEHHGKIWVASISGMGTTVYFSLPIDFLTKSPQILKNKI
jgi:PAS domain S-box-containing protein